MWMRDFLLHERYHQKTLRTLVCVFLIGFTSLGWLLLFSQSITVFVFVHSSWCYFIQHRWSSLNQPISNVFVYEDFNFHHKDGLTFLVELIDLINSAMVFLSQTTLLRWLIFRLGSLSGFHSPTLGFIPFFWTHAIVQWHSLNCEILLMLLS